MRRPLIALTIALAAFVAACSPSVAPGWTYAPPTPAPSVTPAPSGAASAAPSAAPSGAPSAAPSGGAAGGTTVQISANFTAFDQKEVAAPADTGFVIHFDNKDGGVPHNVEIKDANNQSVFRGTIITGPAQADYQVKALPAGTYQFVCSVHANMTGTLKVGG
jgi:plastocyanin